MDLRLAGMVVAMILLTQCIQSPGTGPKPVAHVLPAPDWRLVWSDEFDSTALDTSKWSYQLAFGCEEGICGWGNNEWQFYTSRPANVRVDSGNLILQARDEAVDSSITSLYPGYGTDSIPGGYAWKSPPDSFHHTSARITTRNKGDWKYGKIEVRARIPDGGDGPGVWPAIWMLPTDTVFGHWPRSGELDIMEAYGPAMDTVHQTFHWWGGEGTKGSYAQTNKALGLASWADDFHVYGLEWSPQKVSATLDGRVMITRQNNGSTRQYPYLDRFHLILNIAIGGGALRGGVPFGLTRFPQTMKVDYVRVYQDQNLKAETP
jgi:beta-glucanase (GH16 family)